jgi:hypothetical protein
VISAFTQKELDFMCESWEFYSFKTHRIRKKV